MVSPHRSHTRTPCPRCETTSPILTDPPRTSARTEEGRRRLRRRCGPDLDANKPAARQDRVVRAVDAPTDQAVEAIAAAHRAAGDLSRARDLEMTARVELAVIHRQMPQPRAEVERVESEGSVAVLERSFSEEQTTVEPIPSTDQAGSDAATLAAGDFPVSAREAAKRGPSPIPSKLDPPQREQTRAGRNRDHGPPQR